MYTKILIISTITIFFLATFTTAKPMIKQDFDLISPSSLHKLVKRMAVGYKGSPKSTGFAAIQPKERSKAHKKSRNCEEWKRIPIINRFKCIKFTVSLQPPK